VLCTELEVVDGRYTGMVTRPMIGDAKSAAARSLLAERSVPAARCHAYGDHPSDLPLLSMVGDPVVVGDDPVLLEHAGRHRWRRLRTERAAVS
jgi:phosphoserine phosphatase